MKMYQVQYKELGQWVNVNKPCESAHEAQLIKRGIENVRAKVRIIVVRSK